MGPKQANLHQAENQAHGREDQFPWRSGRLGLIIPAATLIGVVAFVIVAVVIA